MLVVDDPGIAAGLKLLRGEWAERSSGEISVLEWTAQELLGADDVTADAIIYPTRYLGALVEREAIRPVRKSVLASDELALDDIYPLVRNRAMRFGAQVFAISLGEAPLLLVSREEMAGSPEWRELRAPLGSEKPTLTYPLAVEFLLRGSAYARQGKQPVRWFHTDSMQPQLVGEPFVRALTDMIAGGKQVESEMADRLSIGWPSSARGNAADSTNYGALPQSSEVFSPLLKTWEPPDRQREVAYLGFAGRMASVTRATRNSSSAFKLLRWLASPEISTQLSPRSDATLWFRQSQKSKAKKWLGAAQNPDEVTELVGQLLSSGDAHVLPRIPGIDEYLQSLQAEISAAIDAKDSSPALLERIAVEWNEITDRYGRGRQAVVYRRHLGLEESTD
ncbi:MAG: hypothetical protein AAGD11_03260 [Planctomycetota bacterium]